MASEIERAIIELQVLCRNMHQRLSAIERAGGISPAAPGEPRSPSAKPPDAPPDIGQPPGGQPAAQVAVPPPPPAAPLPGGSQAAPPRGALPYAASFVGPTPLRAAATPVGAAPPRPPQSEFSFSDYNARVQAMLQRMAERKKSVDLSIENVIGQSVLSFVGGLVFFGGILLFLRFSFAQAWLQPAHRVFDSLILGAVLLGCGQWFHHARMRPLAAAITAIGLITLMAALFAAAIAYTPPVVSREAAFASVVIVCGAGLGLALQLRMELLAILALVGMYVIPLVLQSPEVDPLDLIVYLSLVTTLGLVLAYFKRQWHWLRIVFFMVLIVPLYFRGLLMPYAWILATFAMTIYTLATGSKRARAAMFALLCLSFTCVLFVSSADSSLTVFSIELPNLDISPWMLLAGGTALFALALSWLSGRDPVGRVPAHERPNWAIIGCATLGTILWLAVAFLWLEPVQLSTFAALLWILALAGLSRATFSDEDAPLLETGIAALLAFVCIKWLAFDSISNVTGDPAKIMVLPGTQFRLPVVANFFVLNGLLIILPFRGARTLRQLGGAFFGWLITALAFVVLIVELLQFIDLVVIAASNPPMDMWLVKNICVSIGCALYALGISIVGFVRQYPTARWVALVLFAGTVIKVLFVDMANVDNSLRILSFIVVGTLLLIVSFLYHKTAGPPTIQPA